MSNQYCSKNNIIRKLGFLVAGAALCFALVFPFPGQAGVYTWKDKSGKVHFTDKLHKIPPEYRTKEKGFKKYKNARPAARGSTGSGMHVPTPASHTPGTFQKKEYVIPLIPTRGGNFMAEVVLNGQVTAHLMVDTGASLVTLSKEIGERLGFGSFSDAPQIPFNTAGGQVWMPMVALDTVRVGNAEVNIVEASLNDQMGDLDGLLGMSFLGDYRVEMDQARSRMILRPLGDPSEEAWGGKTAMWWKSRFMGYTNKIRDFEAEANRLQKVHHPQADKIHKMVGFYKDLHRKLDLQASQSGVPMLYRSYP